MQIMFIYHFLNQNIPINVAINKTHTPDQYIKNSRNPRNSTKTHKISAHLGSQIRPVPELPIPVIRERRQSSPAQKIHAIRCRRAGWSGVIHTRKLLPVRAPPGGRVGQPAPPLENKSEGRQGQRQHCEHQEEPRSEGRRRRGGSETRH